jgi:uncharacterized repeat protein (TIGR03803 family)
MRLKIGAGAIVLASALFAFGGLYVEVHVARADGDGSGNIACSSTLPCLTESSALSVPGIMSSNSGENGLIATSLGWAAPTPARTESVIYNFANPPDAYGPKCNLVFDDAGNMYGTTFSGGQHNLGAVFKITPAGTESVIYSFAGGTDGAHPVGGLTWHPYSRFFFGTTVVGGTANGGTIFAVNPTGSEGVLYSFKGGADGANPYSSLVFVDDSVHLGDFYGTTYNGGAFGYGTVFKFHFGNGTESVLHNFNSAFPTQDGSYPYAGLVLRHGIFFGTTTLGGASNIGTVFSMTQGGTYAVLHSFKGGAQDGQSPYGGVVFDTSGNLYGTTYLGGTHNAGTVFVIPAVGKETVLHHFYRLSTDGSNPYAGLIRVGNKLYGTTYRGGSAGGGTVFKITLAGVETVLHSFTGGTADGANPYSDLLLGASNTFYGTTLHGGTSNIGTVFKLIP